LLTFDFKSALLFVGILSAGVYIARYFKPGVHYKLPRHRKVAVLLNVDDARALVSRGAGVVGLATPAPRICHLGAKGENWQLLCRMLNDSQLTHSRRVGNLTWDIMHVNQCWACRGMLLFRSK
jgi:hypothetical protein